MNIEDTIFQTILPCNLYPMITRLYELSQKTRGLDQLRKDKQIKKLIWLLTSTYYNNQTSLNLTQIWYELKKEENQK